MAANTKRNIMNIVKRTILISGAVVRSVIGIGASALLVLGLKKKKTKKR